MNKNSISLCMIVKNEESHLDKCLSSVKGVVDEIVIVDTGSTDKTKEIAQRHGAKIYDFEWVGDFSAARNYSIEKATSEWILHLDADEFFHGTEALELRDVISTTKANILTVQIHNYSKEGVVGQIHSNIRLYKNNPSIRYKNRIHEQIIENGKYVSGEPSGIRIFHSGYIPEVVKIKGKRERNIELIKEVLSKNPNNASMNYYLGNEYSETDAEQALKYYKKALELNTDHTFQANIVLFMINALYKLNRQDEILELARKYKAIYPDFTNLYLWEADILREFGRTKDAEELYKKCMNLKYQNSKYVTANGVGDIIPLGRLLNLAFEKRDWTRANEYLVELVKFDRYNQLIVTYFQVVNRTFPESEVKDLMFAIYSKENPQDTTMLLRISYALRMKDVFIDLFEMIKGIETEKALFIYHYLKNDEVATRDVLGSFTNSDKDYIICYLLHYLKYKNVDTLAKTENPLINAIVQNDTGLNALSEKDLSLYVSLLEELIKLRDFTLFESALSFAQLFSNEVNKEIGSLLASYTFDELAQSYYLKYIELNKDDHESFIALSKLHFVNQDYVGAYEFAEKAINPHSFLPYEMMIDCGEKLGETEIVRQLASALINEIPDSNYLAKKLA